MGSFTWNTPSFRNRGTVSADGSDRLASFQKSSEISFVQFVCPFFQRFFVGIVPQQQFFAPKGQNTGAAACATLAAFDQRVIHLAFQGPYDVPAAGITQLHPLPGSMGLNSPIRPDMPAAVISAPIFIESLHQHTNKSKLQINASSIYLLYGI